MVIVESEEDERRILDDSGFSFSGARVYKRSHSVLDMLSGISRQRQPVTSFINRSRAQERGLW